MTLASRSGHLGDAYNDALSRIKTRHHGICEFTAGLPGRLRADRFAGQEEWLLVVPVFFAIAVPAPLLLLALPHVLGVETASLTAVRLGTVLFFPVAGLLLALRRKS